MSSNLVAHDTDLIKDVIFRFKTPGLDPGGSFKKGGFRIKFQFPPRFSNDSRKCNWIESPMRGSEPIAIFSTSGSREISLKWTYIAGARGGSNQDGVNTVFTPRIIAEQVRALRSYFSAPHDKAITIDKALIVQFRCWKHTGTDAFTCRINSVDVTHGDALVSEQILKSPQDMKLGDRMLAHNTYKANVANTYALRTDIVVELRLWTRVGSSSLDGPIEDPDKAAKDKADKIQSDLFNEAKLEMLGLNPVVSADWQ